MVCLVLALAAVSFALSVPLTWLMLRVGRRLGQVDTSAGPGEHKKHASGVPTTGGVAIFWAVVLPIVGVLAAAWFVDAAAWSGTLAPVAAHVQGLRDQTPLAVGLLAALLIMHVTGLIDDRRALGPWSKLGVQVVVAAGLVVFFDMRVLEFLGHSYGPPGKAASIALSIVWIVAITNAMNMLDNMDGLSGGVGAIIAALYLAATIIGGQWFIAALCGLLFGALLGFLVFNYPPAKLYMGDAGSLVLGLMLAVLSIRTTYAPGSFGSGAFEPTAIDVHLPGAAWYGILMPLLLLAVPLYDFTSVVLLRLSQGKNPMVGDRQHFSHRLLSRGLTTRQAITVIYLCTIATGLGGVMLAHLRPWQAALVAADFAAVLAMLALLELTNHARSRE